jgi:glycosyltransferase involved in cell wall biosynthesis
MKVLMSAYACEPGKGSEPGAGWAWTRAAALEHEVWVLTRENNRHAIEGALAEEPELNLHPVYLDLSPRARWWKRGQRGVRLYYLLWQRQARRVATRLHAEHQFDVAHHITFGVDWLPAGVVAIPGLPAVWGPVGGTAPFPWRLVRWLGIRGVLEEAVRAGTTGIGRRTVGDRTARQAAVVVAQNREVAARFSSSRVVIEPHGAILIPLFDRASSGESAKRDDRLAVFAGRLLPWKGVALAIAAIADPTAHDWRLRILGEGRDQGRLERLAERLGVSGRVEFVGQVPREEVVATYAEAAVLLFPSLHDSSSWTVAEALTAGLPVVCLDVCGPPVLVERCEGGVAVAPNRLAPAALAAALERAGAPERLGAVDAARLPELLTGFYERATGRNGVQREERGTT